MKSINDIPPEDVLVVLRWIYDRVHHQECDEPIFMLHNTIKRMEKELSVRPEEPKPQ